MIPITKGQVWFPDSFLGTWWDTVDAHYKSNHTNNNYIYCVIYDNVLFANQWWHAVIAHSTTFWLDLIFTTNLIGLFELKCPFECLYNMMLVSFFHSEMSNPILMLTSHD